ncbi:MAG: hypothetical protein QM730_20395 [Anaerolineales bacterium]
MSKLTQAIEYAKEGNKVKARQYLTEIVQTEPNNESAWLWMSSVVEKKDQQIHCLQQALRINPNNQHASMGLEKLISQNASFERIGNPISMDKPQAQIQPSASISDQGLPLPPIARWSNGFRSWGILSKLEDGKRNSSKLGVFIAESGVAENRIFGWAGLFIFLAVLSGVLASVAFDNSPVAIGIAVCFLVAALYRLGTWYLSKDLKIEIYRDGFFYRKDGQEHTVYWREIEYMTEKWEKMVYQGIIHIYTHKVEIFRTNGTKLELNRSLQKIEEMGRYIQLAVADTLLPTYVDRLKMNADCDFGVFTINRSGIKYKGDFLPWRMIRSIEVLSVGRTTLKIQAIDGSKWRAWATENGGSLKNLQLFLHLSNWFINVARIPPENLNVQEEPDNGDIIYRLFLTKKEAQTGIQKTFYVGTSLQERELTVKIPPGTPAGTTYRFPDHGRSAANGHFGTLTVETVVEQVTPAQKKWEQTQILLGIIILMGGLIWLGFWSPLDPISNIVLAALCGGVGGALLSIRQRMVGVLSGVIGGAISFILQFAYYVAMYILFGREGFWNYESVLVLFVSALPGYGLYKLLQKWMAN